MQKTGLGNRFSQETRNVWLYWYECHICRMNQQDVLHHILSKSSNFYVDGDHNESVYNSAPIHNYTHPSARTMIADGMEGFGITQSCHVGNEAYLYSEEIIKKLLNKTYEALSMMQYKPNEKDKKFLAIYRDLYA